ncbi:MAG: glycosyltransferase [Thermotogaceae bacterium]|nr:glycosyltransferase [Thermotogaceae bacterium]
MTVKDFPKKDLKDYKNVVEASVTERILSKAENLKGLKVVHVNATAFGGGVAELLYTLIPLMRSIGIDAQWEVMEAPNDFFVITKKFHNMLQGAKIDLTEDEWNYYLKINEENAKKLNLDADVLIIHDPQPAAIPMYLNTKAKLIWRCHIDLSSPFQNFWRKFKNLLEPYEKLLFHLEEYFPKEFFEKAVQFPPSIDPFSDKNKELEQSYIDSVLERFEINENKPLITVVARFDPWKDLFASIDVYKKVKENIDAQLAIISAMASDDPEGWIFFEKVLRYAGVDDDIKFLTNLIGVGSQEVNAIQRASAIGLHTATREGFGLVISEMMWKGNPVVARPAGGVKIQIDDEENGFLRWKVDELAEAAEELIKNKSLRREMGEKAKEKVRKEFLSTSHLERYLDVILSVFEK